MKFLIGRKLGMIQIFKEDGTVIPVTLIEIEPNQVTQVKTKEKDSYEAVQVGVAKKKKMQKKEFRTNNQRLTTDENLKVGDEIDASVFAEGDKVKVTGITKGKGFQGVVKRHGFHGAPASHGHHHVLRHGGSIGQRFPQHTLKGMRMPGRMGNVKLTVRGLEVVKVDAEAGILAVKGAVPGNKKGLVRIQTY